MSTITKERVAGIASGEKCYTHDDVVELARLALASLEAEPVAWKITSAQGKFIGISSEPLDYDAVKYYEQKVEPLYSAPPVPVSVPDEVSWEDVPEEITEDDMALASAWAHGFNQCRAAMLQGAENAETPTTMQTAPALDSSPKIAGSPSGNYPVIPDGYVLMPVEPTDEMWRAALDATGIIDSYKAMIAAAPQQEAE
ncbi:hypothetical protein [Enterobacter sp. 168J2]|uniref:hypothetical protein n=1 Tax=Enterobacter sp. 168J2 TaxID=3077758 RepID=UPI002A815E6A|nr:hypothetical protein [Enterobacter sp. 168J2]